MEDPDIFVFNNVKSVFWDVFGLSNKAVFNAIVLTLYRLNPCRKPEGQRLGGHVYIKRRNCTLWFWRRKNFATSNWLSKTKQRERLMRCILYSRIGFRRFCRLLPRGRIVYLHWRGAFGVARFDNQGNAKAFMAWNEWQDRLHAFRIYKRVDFVNEGVSWLHLLTELEWIFYETIHIAC